MCENAFMIGLQVQPYLDRARDFLKGMECLEREELYILNDEFVKFSYSLALIGIHCAISYSDALRSGLGREKLSSDDHNKAASDLETLLKSRNLENRKGIGHLKKLLGEKSNIEYEPVTVRENEIEDVVKHTERFAKWAEGTGKKLKIEGW
jgi:hypothetical protein